MADSAANLADNLVDQWYYLDGQETRGPVPSAQIVSLIQAGSLSATAQVAQAGMANVESRVRRIGAFAHAKPDPTMAVAPTKAAPEPLTYAIKVQCISGPDSGKAYMISMAEVSLGRVSGIGQNDPSVAENHVVLSWQRNVLHFRTFSGSNLRVAGAEVTQGTLSNGQQFQLGASVWQVGTAPVELTNLLGTLGARLAKLTSTDKLEGFSLTAMFSEVFKGRKPGEVEDYLIVGTPKTTPHIDDVQTGWPKPWFFMRVLIFMAAVYLIFYKIFDISDNARIVPGLIVMGSLVVPLATVFLFWELNTPRNVSFHMVLILVCLGGVISLAVSLIAFDVAHLEWLGAASAGICEETGKLLTVVLVVRNTKYKYILNGLVFGAAIGGGFGAFETAGYAFNDGFFNSFLNYFLRNPNGEGIERPGRSRTDRRLRRYDHAHPSPVVLCALHARRLDRDLRRRSMAGERRQSDPHRHVLRPQISADVLRPGPSAHVLELAPAALRRRSRPDQADPRRRHRLVRRSWISTGRNAPDPRRATDPHPCGIQQNPAGTDHHGTFPDD